MSRLATLALLLLCCACRAEARDDIATSFHGRDPQVPATAFDLLRFDEFVSPDGQARAARTPLAPDAPPPIDASSVAPGPTGFRIKKGPIVVTAYLDLHCGYCAKAVDWIVNHNGLPHAGLDVVFVSRSEHDRAMAEHVLCAPPHLRRAALLQVFSRGPVADRLRCEKGRAEALLHEGIATRNGVVATPVFAVKGRTVLGFDRERLASLVDQTGVQPKG